MGSSEPGKVGIREVARLAGVSVGSVSNVINRPDRVRAQTRTKVEQAMSELSFVGSRVAGQLRSGRSSLVGVVVPDVGNPFWADVLRGVETVLDEHQLTLLVSSSRLDVGREAAVLTELARQQVDGVIVAPVKASTAPMQALREQRLGVITIDRQLPGDEFGSVSLDDVRGGELAAAHLIANGYTHLVLISPSRSISWSRDRRRGVVRAMASGSLPAQTRLVEVTVQEETTAAGRRAAADALAGVTHRVGVICGNDLLALGVLLHLQEAGRSVPDDVALVGYDDVPFAAALSPALTSVRQPSYKMGMAAAELLITGRLDAVRHIKFEPELIVRASSGPSVQETPDPLA